jgi:hypothetical protein
MMSEYFEVITDSQTGEVTNRSYTAAEIAALQPTTEQLAAEVRVERDRLLVSSDWTQVLDAPVDQAAWASYRQALRDITAQVSFPQQVVWPAAPN